MMTPTSRFAALVTGNASAPIACISLGNDDQSTRERQSVARRPSSRPAAAAKSPGRSAAIGSSARMISEWTARSVVVTWTSTAPTSRGLGAASICHTTSVTASDGALPTSTRRMSGLDPMAYRTAESR